MDSEIEIEENANPQLPLCLESDSRGSFSYLYKYKKKTSLMTQHERREAFLREQKEKRHSIADENRKQLELFIDEPNDIMEEQMDYELVHTAPKERKKAPELRLMQSEWFTEIPDDLEENWLVKFTPVGYRVLIVAKDRRTTFFNVKGVPFLNIQSNFPGGGGIDGTLGPTILDCIFNKKTCTVFILDCLCWNKMYMLDTEARYRFIWLNSKFSEQPNLSRYLKYRFINMKEIPAEKSLIQDRMLENFEVENDKYFYDGITFYHKEGHYTFGFSPLIGWLNSFMLPEMLHIDVAQEHLVRKPKNYQNIRNYLYKRSVNKRKPRRKDTKDEKMDHY